MRFPTAKKTRWALGLVAGAIVVAVACTALPIPLPFQAQATPPAGATPGAAAKPGAQAPGKPGQAGVPVVTAPATQGKITSSIAFSGAITPIQATNLVPKTAGRIEKITVDVGDQIKAGQLLAQLDHGSLDAAVSQAQANLQSAQARLTTVQTGARAEDIASAQAALASQRSKLQAMEQGGRAEDVANAQAALDSAQAKLTQTQIGSKDADIRAAEQGVQAAQAAFDAAVSNYVKLSTPSPDELASAKAAVDKTGAALQQAQANYDKVGWRPDIAGRPESVALQQATADYQNALAQLKIKQQPRPEDLATSQKQVDAARAQLDSAKAKLDQLNAGATPEDLRIGQATVTQAVQALAKARTPNTPQDVEQQRQAVVQAEQNLGLKAQPYTPSDLQTALASVAQAQAALDAAKVAALEGAILAPYDGMVTARLLAEGSLTNATIPALSVATSQVEIITNVEEARIGEMKTGQQATIVVPAYPGVTFPAKVASIAPTADTRTHTFPIKVRPDPVDPRLLAGMFAEVKIITREKDNVVLVPKDGVVQRTGRAQVYLSVDGRARVVDVSAGLSDDRNVEAPSGVKAGDLVIVQGQATVNDGDAVRAAAPSGARPPAGAPGKPEGTPAAAKPEGAAPAKADGADTPVAKPDGGTAAKPAGTTGAKPEGTAAAATPTR